MNDIELYYPSAKGSLLRNSTSPNSTTDFDATDILTTTDYSTTDILETTENFNSTVIGTLVKTAFTMQSIAGPGLDFHSYYIYIWAIGIIGCVLFTTWR